MAEIETLDDWNARMSCCCQMPACPVPEQLCESVTVSAGLFSAFFDADGKPWSKKIASSNGSISESFTNDQYNPGFIYIFSITGPEYVTATDNVTDTRTETEEYLPVVQISKCGVTTPAVYTKKLEGEHNQTTSNISGYCNSTGGGGFDFITHQVSNSLIQIREENGEWARYITSTTMDYIVNDTPWEFGPNVTTNSGPDYEGLVSPTYSYENPVAMDAVTKALKAAIGGTSFEKCPVNNQTLCAASHEETESIIENVGTLILRASSTKVRYRWKIPSSHLGTYFKITWDLLDEDNTSEIPKKTLKTGGTWTWQGPGKKDDPNGDSWKSQWFEIPAPSFKGQSRVVNVRFECYHGPYGSKPQVSGEAYDG